MALLPMFINTSGRETDHSGHSRIKRGLWLGCRGVFATEMEIARREEVHIV